MGQYYTPIIFRTRGNKKGESYYSHDYGNGLKLMEHSYLGNTFVETIVKQLFENEGQVAWVGDYAEPGDVKSPRALKFIKLEQDNNKEYERPEPASIMENSAMLYFVNLDKKEYFSMRNYVFNVKPDKWGFRIHPLPLLTAIGNGKGGGDYHRSNKEDLEMVGYWACDTIVALSWLDEKDFEGYEDITDKLKFREE